MRPIAEYEPMDRERFEREIVARGEPAVFRKLVADWPVVRAARDGPEALAAMLRFAATDEPFEAWFAPPGIEGRFQYNADFGGFNFERKLASLDQLLDLLLRHSARRRLFRSTRAGSRSASICRGSSRTSPSRSVVGSSVTSPARWPTRAPARSCCGCSAAPAR